MLITAVFSLLVLAHLCLKVYLAASAKVFTSFTLVFFFALLQVTLNEEGSRDGDEIVEVIGWKELSVEVRLN